MPSERGVSASPHFHEDIPIIPEVRREIYPNIARSSWTPDNHQLGPHSSLPKPPSFLSPNGKTDMSGTQWESSLFSSSMSELFSRKLRLMRNDGPPSQYANAVASHLEEEIFQSSEEIEAQTIGDLLPDEDDLFTGVVGEAGHHFNTSKGDDMDDFDLFSSGGGMELEVDALSAVRQRNSGTLVGVSNGQRGVSGVLAGEHPDGVIPSRTLLVCNISGNIEDIDLKSLFQQFGDIRALYTAGKNSGFLVVSYYDIRAAQNAMRSLQDRALRQKRLDIHYSFPKENSPEVDINQGTLLVSNLDSSITEDEVRRIFGAFGEIREISDTTYENSQKFVEFFDARAADAALFRLNGVEIAGKPMKIEPSSSGARRFMLQYGREDAELHLIQRSYNNSSSSQIVRIAPTMIASSSMDAGSIHLFPNHVQSPMNSSIEPNRSFGISTGLSSSARVMSNGKPIDIQEPNFLFDEMKIGNQFTSNLHSHSFPEYHDNFASNSPNKSSKTFAEMVGSGQKLKEEYINSTIRAVGSNGHHIGFNGRVTGSSLNESSHGNPWRNSNSQQQPLPSTMMWPNSPSNITGVQSRCIPPVAGFLRGPPVMVTASSPVHHQIGSAPAINPSFWDRKHAYATESPESSSFNLGAHGRFGNSPSHPMDIVSHNFFAHLGGGRLDVNQTNSLPRSPQQMSHLFPGRSPMISVSGSYGSPSERFRNLSHRRNDPSSNNADTKFYGLDVDRILRGEDSRTTLMIKNIPNKYTSKMLLAAIDEYCKGTYDFIYLPIDFKNKCNVGYAFINLIDPQKIVPFYKAFNGKKWEKFNSEKVASIAYARIQGKSALISHFQNSSLMNEDKRCRPILFHTEGPNAGDQEPFPMGSNIRSRPGKPRSSYNDSYNQFSLSVSENQEETSNGAD